jgi:hypothetical protein
MSASARGENRERHSPRETMSLYRVPRHPDTQTPVLFVSYLFPSVEAN